MQPSVLCPPPARHSVLRPRCVQRKEHGRILKLGGICFNGQRTWTYLLFSRTANFLMAAFLRSYRKMMRRVLETRKYLSCSWRRCFTEVSTVTISKTNDWTTCGTQTWWNKRRASGVKDCSLILFFYIRANTCRVKNNRRMPEEQIRFHACPVICKMNRLSRPVTEHPGQWLPFVQNWKTWSGWRTSFANPASSMEWVVCCCVGMLLVARVCMIVLQHWYKQNLVCVTSNLSRTALIFARQISNKKCDNTREVNVQ